MKYFVKVCILLGINLLLLIPIFMLSSLADSRKYDKQYAVENIARGFGGAQKIITPRVEYYYFGNSDYEKHRYSTVLPETLKVSAVLKVETRKYSIYSTQVYSSEITMKGVIVDYKDIADHVYFLDKEYRLDNALFELSISDKAGLKTIPDITINGKKYEASVVAARDAYTIAVPLSGLMVKNKLPESLEFEVVFALNGTSSINFMPTGVESEVNLTADWQHPSFKEKLPNNWSFSPSGKEFDAVWTSTIFNRGSFSKQKDLNHDAEYINSSDYLKLDLVNAVDVYSMADRSIKYGFLFVVLTFMIIFVLETLLNCKVHPIQYGFTGLALVIFFLLLLSMSEHIGFGVSYIAASAACVGLIGFYIHFAFRSLKISVFFTGFLIMLYGILYILLNLEAAALLVGSITIFVILAVIMFVTRKHNWYE